MNKIFHPETKILNDILDKSKSHGDKRGLGYINKTETSTSGKTVFVKGKDETPKQATPLKTKSLCTHCKKSGHAQNKCHTRLLERYESQLSKVVNEFNSLKNNILNI